MKAGLLVLAMTGWAGAQGLPATAPTMPPPPVPSQVMVAAVAPNAPLTQVKKAKVQYVGRTLAVTADNSSLNQILREVSRVTGMKVIGGVAEERVYGQYGPGDVSSVLAKLLGGTGSNMLLILDAREMPAELVLTPRTGGASPPNPAASAGEDGRDEDADVPPQLSRKVPVAAAAAASPQGGFVPGGLPGDAGPVTAQSVPATTTEVSPNGVKTPQQIYDQLMQLQGQQQKAPK